jgi:hypothetical protein
VGSNFDFEWLGDEVAAKVIAEVDNSLVRLGGFLVQQMEQYVAVASGTLKESFRDHFDPSTHTLTVFIPVFYGVYQEFGTRYMAPHPYIRPSIIDVGPQWEGIPIDWTLIIHPAIQQHQRSEPLRATTTGFLLPKRQKLTPGQRTHVHKKLIPVSRRFAHGFKEKGIGFKVVGPKRRLG